MKYADLKEIRNRAFSCSDSLSIESIYNNYYSGKTKKVGSTLYIECPNPACGGHNKSPNKCSITFSKNVYNCFACGESGGPTGFYSRLTGKDISSAAIELAYMSGGITSEEFDIVSSACNKTKLNKDERALVKLEQKKAEEKIYQKQDDYILNIVYETLLSLDEFQLTDEILKYLKEVRGLTAEEAKKEGIFSYHKSFSMEKLISKIREKHPSFSPNSFVGVPGFYFKFSDSTKKSGYWRFIEPSKYKTFGLAIKNPKGEIIALQQRKAAKDHSGYWWISSKNLNDQEEYDFGTSSGSPLHVQYPSIIKNPIICYTEGRFKGIAIAKATGSICICTQGINANKKSVVPIINEIIRSPLTKERYAAKTKKLGFYLMPDADMVTNHEVFRGISDICKYIEESFPERRLDMVIWDIEKGKGFDDFVSNNENWKKMLKTLPAKEYISFFNKVEKDNLKKEKWSGKTLKAINGNPELRKEFYDEVKELVYKKIL